MFSRLVGTWVRLPVSWFGHALSQNPQWTNTAHARTVLKYSFSKICLQFLKSDKEHLGVFHWCKNIQKEIAQRPRWQLVLQYVRLSGIFTVHQSLKDLDADLWPAAGRDKTPPFKSNRILLEAKNLIGEVDSLCSTVIETIACLWDLSKLQRACVQRELQLHTFKMPQPLVHMKAERPAPCTLRETFVQHFDPK